MRFLKTFQLKIAKKDVFFFDKRYIYPMEFEIKNLTLYNELVFTKDEKNPVMKAEELSVFTNCVKKNDMKPERSKYLTEGKWCGYGLMPEASLNTNCKPDAVIPAGKYLFVQFFLEQNNEAINQALREAAAEAVALEGTWQEIALKDTVYVRTLDEGGKKVCQIFREIDIC